MEGKGKIQNFVMQKLIQYVGLFFGIIILFMIFYKLGLQKKTTVIQIMMFVGTIAILAIGGFYTYYKKRGWKYMILSFLAVGIILRIGYMFYTPYMLRSHDLGESSLEGYGHAAYILKLMETHSLPETNWIQFYHPPLFHFLAACTCKFVNILMQWNTYEEMLESAKIVSCYASCLTLLLLPVLCDELGLKEKAKALAILIIAFFPNALLMGGRVNNDSLVVFFMMLAIVYTLKWYKNPSWLHTIVLALAFGLGIMTKTSCGTIAMFTAPFMIIVLVKSFREKKWVHIVEKLAVFACIAFPLGLWYPIRNFIKFKQPLNYVAEIPIDSEIYTGNVSFFERFIQFRLKGMFQPVYANPWEDFNINMYVLKSSMFGEFQYNVAQIIPKVLLVVNIFLVLLSLGAMIYLVCNIKENKMLRFGMPLLWGLIYGFFLYFNAKYPFGCTMDFRYIMLTAFLGAVFLGETLECLWKKKTVMAIGYKCLVVACTILFCLFSLLMFCFIK